MKRTTVVLTAFVFCVAGPVYALYTVSDRGEWPKSWPQELEPLRKQSRTFVGPLLDLRHFAIRFTSRDDFESAWPHLLKVKTKGAPIVLNRDRNFFLGDDNKSGVIIHSPPLGQSDKSAKAEAPIPGVVNFRERWMNTTFIELIVDGEIVDLNKTPLPADTPIIDERFQDRRK